METKQKLDEINSLKLDERISKLEDLLTLADNYLKDTNVNEELALSIITCIEGMRTSRFIESDADLLLLEVSLKIIRGLKEKKEKLINVLDALLYYSNYYPEKYNKAEIEKEILEIKTSLKN